VRKIHLETAKEQWSTFQILQARNERDIRDLG
jgi:hypothetical protein